MSSDPARTALKVFATGISAAIAVGLCRLVIGIIEWWER
jgi:hypothetical protein